LHLQNRFSQPDRHLLRTAGAVPAVLIGREQKKMLIADHLLSFRVGAPHPGRSPQRLGGGARKKLLGNEQHFSFPAVSFPISASHSCFEPAARSAFTPGRKCFRRCGAGGGRGCLAVLDLGSWNGKASAARVQIFASNSACSVSGIALLALLTDQDFQGDCNVLTVGPWCYSDSFDMGFRNDTLSSLYNASTLVPNLYVDSNFLTLWSGIAPGFADNLAPYGANDFISSVSGDRHNDCRR
jgi:hypothetical protein